MNTLKLLIIEDDADQRDLIRETLEDHFGRGTVCAVGSMAEALAQELAGFDLILSDFNLPDATGMDVLAAIQQRCSTPVIMVTGENIGEIAVKAIRAGAIDYIVKVGDYLFTMALVIEKNLSVAKMRRENETLRCDLEKALAEVKVSLGRVEEMAATDVLTGLYNRRHFNRVLDQLFAEAQRYDKDLACVMIDMDGFKPINDTLGHQVGDQLLVTAGKVISANMRRMDVAARYGGDEFVLLLPQANGEAAANAATRINDEFKLAAGRLLNRGGAGGVSMSMGIASIGAHRPLSADALIKLADDALYKAKKAGKDRVANALAA